MSKSLSEQEIDQRLIKLRNLEVAYPNLKEKYRSLEAENALLKARVVELENLTSLQAKQIETLQHTVEELKRIIFGRKSKPPTTPPVDLDNSSNDGNSGKQPRPASSYRRAVPLEEAVTDTKTFTFKDNACGKCGTPLTKIKNIIRYVEDMLPLSEWGKALKKVTRMLITTGYCSCCKQRVTAKAISPQPVTLGENLKGFVTFANVVLRLSYGQVNDLLKTIANISISDGEQDNILYGQADNLKPEYEQIKVRLNQESSNHYDETSWPTQKGKYGDYAWIRASSITEEAIFLIGQNRGKGNLKNLKGPPEQVGTTDDYGAYKRAFRIHALCWAHPHRKFRDLTEAGYLTTNQIIAAATTYKSFADLYHKVRTIYNTPFNQVERLKLLPELEAEFTKIYQSGENDPRKLVTLKESLRKNMPCYFVCITTEGVAPDNNKAERTLRHLVLKRKNSYGSKTQKGADASSVLYSVLLSLWRTSKTNFFAKYQQLLENTQTLQTSANQLA